MRLFLKAICGLALVASCESFVVAAERQPSVGYEIHEGKVTFFSLLGRQRVDAADPATFQYIAGGFGKDRQHVFFGEAVVEGADPASFRVIDFATGQDNKSIYRASTRCAACDVKSFRKIDEHWYIDDGAAYRGAANGWDRIPDMDRRSFQPLNNWYAKDNRSVIIEGERITGADAHSFKLESCGTCEVCGEDKSRCYWFEHPVPCDCRPHSGAEFPIAMNTSLPGKAVLKTSGPISIDAKSVKGVMSAGYLLAEPGNQRVALTCWDPKTRAHVPVGLTVSLEPNRFYRFARSEGATCDFHIERPAMVRGRMDGPEVQIRVAGDSKTKMLVELTSGTHTLTAVCRDVTRIGVNESTTDFTVDATAGEIYELNATFEAPANTCRVGVAPLGRP
jgi:DKNYY family